MGKMEEAAFLESLKKEAKEMEEREKWAELRRTAVMNFATAILSNPAWYKRFTGHDEDAQFDNAYYKKHVIDNAISYADYLIGVLKDDERHY